jgi:hypothetical protein
MCSDSAGCAEKGEGNLKEACMRMARMWRSGLPRVLLSAVGLIAALLLLLSCDPDAGFNTVSDYDVVATFYDPDADFDSLSTYAMPDTIIHFRDPEDTSDVEITREYDELVLNLVRTNLEDLGYVEEADPGENEPDVFVIVGVTMAGWLSSSTDEWWDRWGWYLHWPPSWGPAWGTWYPYPVEYYYRAGTIFIDMIDEAVLEEGEEPYIKIIWTGTVNGLMVDTSAGAQERLTDNINQAFYQSPYLAGE